MPPTIVAAPIAARSSLAQQLEFSHVVTLLSPDGEPSPAAEAGVLHLSFNDIHTPQAGLVAPSDAHIAELLAFSRAWDECHVLGVFCYAGVSRSSAAAYIVACDRNTGLESAIAEDLRRRAPFVTPNPLMIAIADRILARKGRMIEAIRRIGRGADVHTGSAYELPARWNLS